MELEYRNYEPKDFSFVYELKKECYYPYVSQIWGWEEELQRELFATFMETACEQMAMVLADSTLAGMVNWTVAEDGSCLEIQNICLQSRFRNKGIGTGILKRMIQESSYPCIKLQVFKNNPAIALYERLGFVIAGESENHYQMKLHREETK